MIALWLATGILADPGHPANVGDDAGGGYRKGPIVEYRPKVEREIARVLARVEDIKPAGKTSEKRKAVKKAREAFRAIEMPTSYGPASKAISEALARVSRAAGEYEAFQSAAMQATTQIEALIAKMERDRRAMRRREEEMVIQWLLN